MSSGIAVPSFGQPKSPQRKLVKELYTWIPGSLHSQQSCPLLKYFISFADLIICQLIWLSYSMGGKGKMVLRDLGSKIDTCQL